MGKRAKMIVEIERRLARLEDQPGLCLYYTHHTASVLWQHKYRVVIYLFRVSIEEARWLNPCFRWASW